MEGLVNNGIVNFKEFKCLKFGSNLQWKMTYFKVLCFKYDPLDNCFWVGSDKNIQKIS